MTSLDHRYLQMDGNFLPLPSDGAYIFDQSLEFITEDFEGSNSNSHDHNTTNNKRRSLSSLNTLGSGDVHRAQDSTRKPPRPQRQKSLTSEQTKHRRTRSGCYTCRQRRVKCDEGRPICDRCRKGKRDCTYPDKTTSSKSNRTAPKSKSPDTYSSSSSDEQDDSQQAFPTPDASEGTSVASFRPARADSKRSTMLEEYNGAVAEMQSHFDQAAKPGHLGVVLELFPEWSTLPSDIKFYLEFFRDHITYCHYAFKHDCRDFLKTSYLEAAFNFKPLLYALVSFTAYHYALRHPDTKPEKFLDYYDQAVSLFRAALAKGNSNAVPVLLTMLQLATIEEFLGDWVGLSNHQKAAAKLMQETFTPNAMTQTFTHRVILVWYWRFDLFAGVISGNPLTLPREWFASCVDSCAGAAARNTEGSVGVWFDHFFTKSRMLVTDITLTFSPRTSGFVEDESFEEKVVKLWARIEDHAQRVETAFRDVACFGNTWLESDDSLTDYTDPYHLFTGPYFTMNYILADSCQDA
ncbi:hypothetical protein AMS68_006561 [Peltaster fructicola]|uniref:Zn(2)-C6 fungal-type domain-containing protein n=1 Tax=Peltaster fructicola TaxID=286661 RepID=A0A6H0Y212_9PEZI|nr:hypothetical protein AMS68_006561 [Peltaster fructicola]